MATIDDLKKIELRVGTIVDVEVHEKAIKPIYKLKVDLGELGIREIAAGIRDKYSKEDLVNKQIIVVANLEPKDIAGFVSNGMLLAAEDDENISLLTPDRKMKPGSKIR
ncbi:EMAP domain tRNA-binding protein [Candidatus Mancarchaeum acidiphilum]|uniref:Methionine--tRNA ligase n=1 Tax=Candidatus Mancarchaeum acidiphilum TaxID=1920749 RepID=A0A218NNM7_9ARCH|nr:tRNA-binding protein [Candidatus Mancarchaeum acidiphilum]ASI14078.1 EMAP domain tRNA-binding protein [Candidatus Mancarchaeum acidiphilum]